jgi:glycosyltransferase involved in cell wall biosynthesis
VNVLRVLAVHSSAELYGSDRSLLDFVRLRPAGVAFTVVLPEPGPLVAELQAVGAQVLVGDVSKIQRGMFSPSGLWRTLRSVNRSVRFLGALHRAQPFDLVYSNSVAILGGALFARIRRLPHVWHVREILPSSGLLTWGFRRLVSALSSRVICNSSETMAWIRGGSPRRSDRYVAIWNGYDQPQGQSDRSEARLALGASGQEVLFVLVGRLNAWKGQGLLVDAFSDLVRGAGSPVRLAIVGSAFAGQEHFERKLRSAIAASGCAKRIGLFPFRADIDRVWAAADVAVVPSTDPEPFGRVAVEAMAFGKPVVAAAHGGLIEIVKHGVTGFLVAPRDRQALCTALKTLADSADLRDRFGLAGRQRQLDYFSVQGYVDRVAAVFVSAIAGAPVKP